MSYFFLAAYYMSQVLHFVFGHLKLFALSVFFMKKEHFRYVSLQFRSVIKFSAFLEDLVWTMEIIFKHIRRDLDPVISSIYIYLFFASMTVVTSWRPFCGVVSN